MKLKEFDPTREEDVGTFQTDPPGPHADTRPKVPGNDELPC